jgi:DNA helicase MCM9
LKGRNKILASICPQIYGLFLVKLAVALTLIGGCAQQDDAGTHIRGEVHMLLIGDPGTGKSQASLCPQGPGDAL